MSTREKERTINLRNSLRDEEKRLSQDCEHRYIKLQQLLTDPPIELYQCQYCSRIKHVRKGTPIQKPIAKNIYNVEEFMLNNQALVVFDDEVDTNKFIRSSELKDMFVNGPRVLK